MKILMFGWEFPPHITGGLGTACYGLTKGLSAIEGCEVIFVVPKVWGDEESNSFRLVGANRVPVRKKMVTLEENSQPLEFLEVDSPLIPYSGNEMFWKLKAGRYKKNTGFVEISEDGTIPFSGGYNGAVSGEIRKYALVAEIIAAECSFDLIHAHDWLAYPAGIAAKRKSGKPLVIHVHATEFDRGGGNVNPEVYNIEREGMELADRIITVSNLTRNTVIEKYGIEPGKVVTVYNAVEPVTDDEKKSVKKGITDRIVTFLGRITYQKGPEYFIEAAALVLKEMNHVRFVMAGSGDMMNAMVEHTARLGITDRFHFTGFLTGDDVYKMLKISDVVVMPSVSEPFGIVPLEAMQSGIPVIVSRQSGVAEILQYAIKTDFWDTHALADAIYGLLNYPSLSRLLSMRGLEETSTLKWKNAAMKISGIYRTCMENCLLE
jgi:glycosyltransferase involved in cell wall biosynthesis